MRQAIILSAGQGSRLGHLTTDRPKCLIEFGGRTLLDRQLDVLAANGITEAIVVTGFRDDQIEAALERRRQAGEGPATRTIFNPFYKVADNTGSLFMAREALSGDTLVWNGDTMVSPALMARVVANDRPGICVTIDRKAEGYDADDMKVVEEDGRLRAIGKRLADSDGVNAESIGLLAFRGDGAERFRSAIEQAMRSPEGTQIWYLRVIHHLAQESEVVTLSIEGEQWGEVDFPEDVAAAEELVKGW
ncbi:NTP transferase domain-containing protein [Sphingomonas swuensis]|uniref:NTP transferase domain-containing protein n=1 Tax=Sphingomonas swuensis TaxID=977800 RepID=A0ABP7SS46_9SPHN